MAWTNAGKVAIVPKGAWSISNTYERLDLVTNNNIMYIAKQDVPANTAITNTTYWQETITGQSTPIATTSVAGSVMPDGTSVKIKNALTGLIGVGIKDLGYIDMEDAQVSLHTYFEGDTMVMFRCQEAGEWGQTGIIMDDDTRSQLTTDDQGNSTILFVLFPCGQYDSRTALAIIEGSGECWNTALLMEDMVGDDEWHYKNLWVGDTITVDSALSTISTNPVQNNVITKAIRGAIRLKSDGAIVSSLSSSATVADLPEGTYFATYSDLHGISTVTGTSTFMLSFPDLSWDYDNTAYTLLTIKKSDTPGGGQRAYYKAVIYEWSSSNTTQPRTLYVVRDTSLTPPTAITSSSWAYDNSINIVSSSVVSSYTRPVVIQSSAPSDTTALWVK